MRPTLLDFRSSKEKTPFPYTLNSTYDGRMLNFHRPKGDPKRSSFSKERRFIAYDILAKRTGYRVGPGAYRPENYKDRIKSGSPYKEYHCQKQTDNNGYYMVGNVLEFDPALLLSSRKKLQKEPNIKLDSAYLSNKACRSAATTTHSMNFENSEKKMQDEDVTVRAMPFTPRARKQRPKKIKKLNKSLKIEHLLKKRFH